MKESLLKVVIRRLFFPPGAVRTIRFGPMRGMVFRVSSITEMSPWYSGSEPRHQRAFRKLVREGDVVIDIGANWGLHTLYLWQLVGSSGRVIAVEPYPPAFAELEWHIAANGCNNATPMQVAIADSNEEAMFVPGESSSTGHLALATSPDPVAPGAMTVPVCSLDDLALSLGLERIDLVKVDVEGAEGRVLSGAEEAVARFHPCFAIDLHTPELDVFVGRWLTNRGYRLERLSGPPILRTDVGWPDPNGVWGSILALPNRFGSRG